MYKCPSCKRTTAAGESQNKVVTEYRVKKYANEIQVGKFKKVKESEGWEVVKEVGVCSDCYAKVSHLETSLKEKFAVKQISKFSR